MGGSSSQVVGYRYYAKFAAFIGNRIEKLIGVNFDNRKWVVHDPVHHPVNMLPVIEGNLFGENEGGVAGDIDIHFGYPNQEPNLEYQKHFPLVSGYPYQSYLLFRGHNFQDPFLGHTFTTPAFYLGNSGYMKEMLLWVKRIHVKNNGDVQWHDSKSEVADPLSIREVEKPEETTFSLYGSKQSGTNTDFYPIQLNDQWKTKFTRLLYTGTILAGTSSSNDTPVPNEKHNIAIKIDLNHVVYCEFTTQFNYYAQSYSINISGDIISSEVLENGNAVNVTVRFIASEPFIFGVTITGTVPRNSGRVCNVGFTNSEIKMLNEKVFAASSGDINPIHKIREILTDDTAMDKPESDVNDINFMKAANRIWDEGLGVSWAIDEKSCIDAIEELCYHIEAGIRVNRQTGLHEMVLFRDDWFEENEIHDISENKIKDLSLEVMNSDDIVNQLNVTYYDRERIKNSTFSVYENGSILTMGHANAESVEFPYFMNMRNAEIVANWKLKQFSTPAWSGSFTTGWKEARKWNRYDLIRLPWSKKWNGTILVRIMKINLGNGTDNTVTIDFEEVIPYSGEMNTSIVVDAPIESAPQLPQPSINYVFEAPYYLTMLRAGQANADLELSNNPDIGYVAAIAAKPQNNSLSALLYTDGGVGEFEQVSRLDYCDILQLEQPIIETTSSFTVTGSLTQTTNSNNLILLNGELMGFVAFDDATKVLTVKRGVLDTVPKKHSSGSLFIFDLPDVAFDSTQYAQGEVVEAQVLTTTPSGIQELIEAGVPVEIESRAIRPYPPANVRINNTFMPMYFENDFTLTWSDRNRLQQTGGEMIGYFEPSVTLEPNTQTLLTIIELDVDNTEIATHSANVTALNSFMLPESALQPGALTLLVSLKTMRDGYECLNQFTHSVKLTTLVAPTNVSFEIIEY